MPRNLFIVIVSPFEDNFLISINHPLTNITLACAEPSLHYFQHLKLHAHVSVVFVLSPSPQCQNIGLGGGGEQKNIPISNISPTSSISLKLRDFPFPFLNSWESKGL